MFNVFDKKKTEATNSNKSLDEENNALNNECSIVYLSSEKNRTVISEAKVTPVIQQHYWQCYVAIEFSNDEWTALITDTYARDRYNDEDVSCRVKLPKIFPYMRPEKFADFLNCISPCGRWGEGHREINPSEVSCLIRAALNKQFERTTKNNLCVDTLRIANDGYFDSACSIMINNKKRFYYFKETGNNKGYCLGTVIYEIDESTYEEYKANLLDRNALDKFIIELPAGDRNWMKDQFLLQLIFDISEGGE